jgi:hypothetical protein
LPPGRWRVLLERRDDVEPCRAASGRKAAQERACQREQQRIRQHPSIEREIEFDWYRQHRDEHVEGTPQPQSEDDSRAAPYQR